MATSEKQTKYNDFINFIVNDQCKELISEFLEDLLDDDNSRLFLIGKWAERKDLKWEAKLTS